MVTQGYKIRGTGLMENNLSLTVTNEERQHKHQNNERLCYCCDTLQPTKDDIHILEIGRYDRGYPSKFVSSNVKIQLCPSCLKEEYEKWFYEIPVIKNIFCEEYKYEENIKDFINSFILENQEYVWNYMDFYTMEREDWLDMKRGTLPDYKYKEYGMYSPSEFKSYEERFPTCQFPANVVYSDGSKGCKCPFGASGDFGQKESINISIECNKCECYQKRIGDNLRTLELLDFGLYEQIIKGEIAKIKFEQKINANKGN